jgi:hypothetical protein
MTIKASSILRHRLAVVLLLVAPLLSLGVASVTLADTGTPVPGALWTVPVSVSGSFVVTVTGQVLALGCSTSQGASDPLAQSLTPDGSVLWSVPANVAPAWGCSRTAVGDSQGNTYLQTVDTQGNAVFESLTPLGGLRWSTPLGRFRPWYQNPVLGTNGSVYLVETDEYGNFYLFGYDANTGVVTLNGIPFPYITGLYAYSGGLAVVNTNAGGIFGHDSEVDYLSYDGTVLHSYDTGAPISFNGNTSNAGGANGSVFVAGYPPTCYGENGYPSGSHNLTNLSVEKITPSGIAWTWTDNIEYNCGETKLAATPDGGVILERTEEPSNYAADFSSIGPTGVLRWTHHASGPLGPAYVAGSSAPVVDSNGVVALPSGYQFECPDYSTLPCSGVQVEFVTQGSASATLPTLQVSEPANRYFSLSSLGIDTGRVYLERIGAPIAGVESLSGFAVPGLATDYRLVLQEALAAGAPSPLPSDGSATDGGPASLSVAPLSKGAPPSGAPSNPCIPISGSVGKRLLASLKCTVHLTTLEVECGVAIFKLIFLPFKELKLIEAAKTSDVIAKLPIKFRPIAKFFYDLAHAKYSKNAPRGFRDGSQAIETIRRIMDASRLIRDLPDLAKAVSLPDFSRIALDIDDIVGLKSCVQGVADGLAG